MPSTGRRLSLVRQPALVAIDPDDLFVWFEAVRETTEYMSPETFSARVGLDWEACNMLGVRLLTHRANADQGDTIHLPIPSTELDAIRRCIVATIERIGAAESYDRVSGFMGDLRAVLRRLEERIE